jgi:hypothetical protein
MDQLKQGGVLVVCLFVFIFVFGGEWKRESFVLL